jgi:uncharacterized protein YfdQ (DUF2303 family)
MSFEAEKKCDTQAAVDAGMRALDIGLRMTKINPDDLDGVFVAIDPNGKVTCASDVQSIADARLPEPRRRFGRMHVLDQESFIKAVNRWKASMRTTVWAQVAPMSFTAVVNEYPDGPDGAAWRDFRIVYQPPASPEWMTWTGQADKDMTQDAFAQFIDENAPDVVVPIDAEKGKWPSQVELLEMARNLQVYTRGAFERKIDPATGTGSLVVKDEHETYSTKIWRAFPLALRVFEGGKHQHVEARIKFSIANGKATFRYSLYRSQDVMRKAFDSLRSNIEAQCIGCPLYMGQP